MIKHVVVNLTVDGRSDPAPEFAISLARMFGAELFGVAFAHEPVLSPDIIAGMPANLLQAMRAQSEKAAGEVIARFAHAAQRVQVAAETRMVTTTDVGAANYFGQWARTLDLAVVGQAAPDDVVPQDMVVESALLESGRPIIVVPYIQKDPIKLDHIMLCWDGGRAAARAAGDALPLLERASHIDVVTVKDKDRPDEPPATAADVARHLRLHGLEAKDVRLVAPDVEVSDMLLSYAADNSVDFMVMGGYGHAKLREIVLGGVTRGILSSMTVPVLMSH